MVISVLWLIASPIYLLVMKNEAPNKSYAACIEESLMTGTRMRETGKHDEADAWDRHSNDWCLGAAGHISPVGLAHVCSKEPTIAPSCGASSWGQSRCCGLSEASW